MIQQYLREVKLRESPDESSYLSQLPVVRALMQRQVLDFSVPVTFLVGENGTGKSTLLEAIAVAYGFNAEGGSKNFSFSTNATHSDLHLLLRLIKGRRAKDGFFLRAESLYNFATNLDELDRIPSAAPRLIDRYGGTSLHRQSHGESFLSLIQNRFGGGGFYLLDEPEAALSPSRLLVLIAEIDALVKRDSQFVIATHSPMLMAFPGAKIYQLSEAGIDPVGYEETEHFQLTKRFLNHPESVLKYLLEETT